MHRAFAVVHLGMNKEVNYVLQGFLLTLVVIGAFKFGGLLLSIPPPPSAPPTPDSQAFLSRFDNAKTGFPSNGIDGKMLFQDNCAACHSVSKDLTGPALIGVQKRISDKKLLYKWVRNPAAVLKSGNVYFNELKKRFGGAVMTSFSSLSDQEIDAIISYVERNSLPMP
jgi:cytochrome c2